MKKIILFVLLLNSPLFFLSCQNDRDDDLCIPDPKEDCICTREYNPVCGCDGEVYSNPCQAECNGIFNYTLGPC